MGSNDQQQCPVHRTPRYPSEDEAKLAILGSKIRSAINGGSRGDENRAAVFCEICEGWHITPARRQRRGGGR